MPERNIDPNRQNNKALGRFDGEIQMYCAQVREPYMETLQFLRWMVEKGRLEHPIAGPRAGDLAFANGDTEKVDKKSEEEPKILFKTIESNKTYYSQLLDSLLGESKVQALVPLVEKAKGSKRLYALNEYDTDLKMVKEPAKDPIMGRLGLLRWLAEQDRLEHPPVGPSSGEFTDRTAA